MESLMGILRGRTNRATYLCGLAIVAAMVALVVLFAPDGKMPLEVVLVFLCVPRLHDIGRSGWYVLAFVLVEIVGVIVAFTTLPLESAASGLWWVTLVWIALALGLGLIPGESSANRFGEPPAPGIQWGKTPKT